VVILVGIKDVGIVWEWGWIGEYNIIGIVKIVGEVEFSTVGLIPSLRPSGDIVGVLVDRLEHYRLILLIFKV